MVARAVAAIALVAAVACGSMPRPPIGAPQDTYTPRQFAVEVAGASSTVDGAFVTERFFTTEHVQPNSDGSLRRRNTPCPARRASRSCRMGFGGRGWPAIPV